MADNKVRLQKYLSECGVASRRKAEDLIAAGIKYTVDAKGRNTKHTVARAYTGTGSAAKTVSGIIYDIYVHQKDYDRAVAVINKKDGF